MGYAFYEINGKPCGYSVEAKCEEPGCNEDCGRHPGGDEFGCGGYFCGKHLTGGQQCQRCSTLACDECQMVCADDGLDEAGLCQECAG